MLTVKTWRSTYELLQVRFLENCIALERLQHFAASFCMRDAFNHELKVAQTARCAIICD